MKLDRPYQLELLNELARHYPRPGVDMAIRMGRAPEQDKEKYLANIMYLAEHGLIEGGAQLGVDLRPSFTPPKLTCKGMDFIADDGGLSAILGVATIRIHGDTIKDMLEMWIEASAESQPNKHRMRAALQALPADATKHLAMKLIDMGLAVAPATMLWLQTHLMPLPS